MELAPRQLALLTEVLWPLLAALVREALEALPERLPAFLVLFLLPHLKAPRALAAPLFEWLQSPQSGLSLPTLSSPMPQVVEPGSPTTPGNQALRSRAKRSREAYPTPAPEVSLDQAAALIRGVPLFRQLDDEDVEALATCAEVCFFDTDREVVRRGARHDALHMILSGEGHVSVPQVVGTLRHGDSFGEHAIVKRHLASTHSITAQGDDDNRLVTLAIRYDDCARLGVLSRIRTKRTAGLTTNVVTRSGATGASASRRSFRAIHSSWNCGGSASASATGLPSASASSSALPADSPAELTPEDRQLIHSAIRANAHFSEWLQLSHAQLDMMADMMRLTMVESGHEVVKKGEHGSKFYIVNDGILEVVAGTTQTEMEIKVRLRSGDSFGELALLYNCPRKATVRAQRPCKLWYLDRAQFRSVMRAKSDKRILEYDKLISSVPLLNDRLSDAERGVLADALEESFFVRGEEVVTQADPAHVFFIVFEGCCEIRVNGEARGFLQKGNVFWEHMLLNKELKAVTVVVTSETATLLTFDGASCLMLLGPASSASGGLGGASAAVGPGSLSERRRASACAANSPVELMRRMLGDVQSGGPRPKVPWEDLETLGALGYGSFGCVTLRRDRRTGHLYAMKALSKSYIKRESMEQHVISERKTMEMLDSKFLVRMHCTYRCSRFVYFLLAPALGGELYDVYVQNEDMFGSEAHAKFYVVCCALGVQHMHDRHIIYRDLKLENVLLYSNGYACLTDMGLAKVVIGKTYTVCGTADYFAPETLRQSGHNRAVDWWALGIMLFIMMSGRSPFDAEDVMQIYRNIVKGFKRDIFPSDFHEDLTDLVLGLCRKKPEKRIAMAPGGAANVRAHRWFDQYPWDLVAKRTYRAPYQPVEPNFAVMREALEQGPPKGFECFNEESDGEQSDDEESAWDADF